MARDWCTTHGWLADRLYVGASRPEDRLLLYHDEEAKSFGPDVFDLDLDKFPMMAFAGP